MIPTLPVLPNYDDQVITDADAQSGVQTFTVSWYTYLDRLLKIVQALVAAEAPTMNVVGPFSAAFNISADLTPVPDTRPGTWGSAAFADNNLQFNPPAGYRVRILKAYGNWFAMPKVVDPGAGPYPADHGYCGVLWGLLRTGVTGSTRLVPASDEAFAFYQGAIDGPPQTFPFDFTLEAVAPLSETMGLLDPDNIMVNRLAIFLDTLGDTVPIHMESQMVVVYQFEPPA